MQYLEIQSDNWKLQKNMGDIPNTDPKNIDPSNMASFCGPRHPCFLRFFKPLHWRVQSLILREKDATSEFLQVNSRKRNGRNTHTHLFPEFFKTPDAQCIAYLPTFGVVLVVNVGKYTSPIEHLGFPHHLFLHWTSGVLPLPQKNTQLGSAPGETERGDAGAQRLAVLLSSERNFTGLGVSTNLQVEGGGGRYLRSWGTRFFRMFFRYKGVLNQK